MATQAIPVTSNIIVADLGTKLPGQKVTKEKRRLKWSNFYITINTNQQFDAGNEGLAPFVARFEAVANSIFSDTAIVNFLEVKVPDHSMSPEHIRSIGVECVIERGGKNKTIHLHALVKVSHWTQVHLCYDKIREKITKDMKLSNVYMKNTLYRNAGDSLQKYVYKDVYNEVEPPAEAEQIRIN